MEIAVIVAKSHHSRCYRLFHVQDLLVQKHQACSVDLNDQHFGKDDNLGAHKPICEYVRDHGSNNRTKVTLVYSLKSSSRTLILFVTFMTNCQHFKTMYLYQKINLIGLWSYYDHVRDQHILQFWFRQFDKR